MKLVIAVIIFGVCLTGCNFKDEADYFSNTSESTTEIYNSALEKQVNEIADKAKEKIDDFDPYTPNSGLPESVYRYDVEESFNLEDSEETTEKSLKDYWDGMWKDNPSES